MAFKQCSNFLADLLVAGAEKKWNMEYQGVVETGDTLGGKRIGPVAWKNEDGFMLMMFRGETESEYDLLQVDPNSTTEVENFMDNYGHSPADLVEATRVAFTSKYSEPPPVVPGSDSESYPTDNGTLDSGWTLSDESYAGDEYNLIRDGGYLTTFTNFAAFGIAANECEVSPDEIITHVRVRCRLKTYGEAAALIKGGFSEHVNVIHQPDQNNQWEDFVSDWFDVSSEEMSSDYPAYGAVEVTAICRRPNSSNTLSVGEMSLEIRKAAKP